MSEATIACDVVPNCCQFFGSCIVFLAECCVDRHVMERAEPSVAHTIFETRLRSFVSQPVSHYTFANYRITVLAFGRL